MMSDNSRLVLGGPEVPNSEFKTLIIWHGNYMLFACLVLMPAGMTVSRYMKETWTTTCFSKFPLWLIVHFTYMISALIIMVLGLFLILAKRWLEVGSTEKDSMASSHSVLGYLAVILCVIQFVGGNFVPCFSPPCSGMVRIYHWIIGIFTTGLCLILSLTSTKMVHSRFPYFSSVIIFAWFFLALVMHILMAYSLRLGDREVLSKRKHGVCRYYRAYLPVPVPFMEERIPGARLRLIMFLWFQFLAAAMFIPILITNSQGQGRYDCQDWSAVQTSCDIYRTHIIL